MFFEYATLFLGFCLTSNHTLKTHMNMDNTAIWYLLHFICNMMVIYLTFNDLKICFTSQSECYDKTHFDSSALGITFGLHTFHMIRDYKTLTIIDWLHHLISSWFMSLLGLYYYHMPLWNCGTFFLCGLPGGIDYLLLFLYKMNIIDKMTEKLDEIITPLIDKVPTQVGLQLPKLKKVGSSNPPKIKLPKLKKVTSEATV